MMVFLCIVQIKMARAICFLRVVQIKMARAICFAADPIGPRAAVCGLVTA